MYLDALEFLEEERDAWASFEALADLTDEQLTTVHPDAHGWSGRDLMAHLVAWQEVALRAARELAVDEISPTIRQADADWDARGGEVINAELSTAWADRPLADLRAAFASVPGELRGTLTVVPESRWLKHADHQTWFRDETIAHYESHVPELRAILTMAEVTR